METLSKSNQIKVVRTLFWSHGLNRCNLDSILEHQFSSTLSLNVGVKIIVGNSDSFSLRVGFLFGICLYFGFHFSLQFLFNFLFSLLRNFLFNLLHIICLIPILLLETNSLNRAGA
jgi:hypothetical protein